MMNNTSVNTAQANTRVNDDIELEHLKQAYSSLSLLDLNKMRLKLIIYSPFKRLIDFLFALFLITFFAPLMLIVSLLILIIDGRPVFFRQERTTFGLRKFKIFKFRTMVNYASTKGPIVTKFNDQRITTLGKILRKTKVDEIPQVFNIIFGDMSFVGPRPEVTKIVEHFPEEHKLLFSYLRAGLTDYASFHFEREEVILNKIEDPEKYYIEEIMPEKLNLQFKYLINISWIVDLHLSVKTFTNVFVRRLTQFVNLLLTFKKQKH